MFHHDFAHPTEQQNEVSSNLSLEKSRDDENFTNLSRERSGDNDNDNPTTLSRERSGDNGDNSFLNESV